ncbi:endonuclease/exonuclease/phosphatase family protein [Arenibaculum sp.]|jgi:endonuclease/exonuclease/phosphatase (EEP) superfamily protein YafD|uniref:endonuclease/exonuclease/phosphatase family protein n=1 Tax=Arenibaculum sp. TaxID=2865862 RepID=UPI002E132EC1|nr:endonuclease/exonuclease/phosphatase family protein [Arenibaculum sp.]
MNAFLRGIFPFIGAILVVASFLPLTETNIWWVRVLDFPRLQFMIALAVVGALIFLFARPRRIGGWLVLAGMVAAVGCHVYKLHPYWEWVEPRAVAVSRCADGSRLRVLVANVQKGNRQDERLLALVEETDPDVFLAMETDEWWNERLAPLRNDFAHQVQHVGSGYFGMHLFSKYELVDPEIRFLAEQDVPSIFTDIRLPDGQMVEFLGIHPRPPRALQPSTGRDAQILAAALEARASAEPSILAGDLNAVPWERVVRRAMRIGRLLDPRVGRGYIPTYDAQQLLLSWPLDQVLYEDAIGLTALERLPEFGSDHYPYLADLCHAPVLAERQHAPEMEEGDLAEAQTSIESAIQDARG